MTNHPPAGDEGLRQAIAQLTGRVQDKPKIKGDFVTYTYYSPNSPEEITDNIMRLIDAYTARKVREARIDELESMQISHAGTAYSVDEDRWMTAEEFVEKRLSELNPKDQKEES